MQTGSEFRQRVMNVVALVLAMAICGVTVWGATQMVAADVEILGAAVVPWVYPPSSSSSPAQMPASRSASRVLGPRS